MNISNLKEGMEIKNYKELCKLLGIEPVGGNAKIKQLEELSLSIEFNKKGNSIMINKIHDSPIQANKTDYEKYIDNIERLILHTMYINDDEYLLISKSKLLRVLEMVNPNYHECKNRVEKLSSYLDIDKKLINEWYASTGSMLERNLLKVFKSLDSKALAHITKDVRMVCEVKPHSKEIHKSIITDEYDEEQITYKLQSDCGLEFRKATEKECRLIGKLENEALKHFECSKKDEIVAKGKWWEYKSIINDKLLKRHNIAFYYDAYEIIYTSSDVKHYINNEILDCTTKETNVLIQERIISNVKKKQKKAEDCIKDGTWYNRKSYLYLENNEKLNCTLIDIDAENITRDIKKYKIDRDKEIKRYASK